MKMKVIGMLAGLLVSFLVDAADASITDVTARQRYPWNGKVDISYKVSGITAAAKQKGWITSLKVTAKDNDTDTTYTATSLTGDASLADGTHAIIWDMSAQGLTFKSTNVTFNVTCETEDALYCVVDLSAGANATSYPVSYMSAIPSGSWSDTYKTTKLVLRRIEPGTCVVTVDAPYYIGVFEVTHKQYELITGTTPSYFSGNDKRPVECVSYNMIRGSNKGSQYPISTDVDDDSCVGKLRTRTGMHFDLPTEAQWEYACRAGTTTTYSYGNTANGDYMWYAVNSGAITHEVGTRKPNPWGLYDVHGNVYEWCLDWYNAGWDRVLRGGEWSVDAVGCTSSYRYYDSPSFRCCNDGFRLARTLSNNVWASFYGESDIIHVDLHIDTRTAAKTEVLTYSTAWVSGAGATAEAVVAIDGEALSSETGSGTVEWTPKRNGTYELTHTVKTNGVAVGETLTASFLVDCIPPVTAGESFEFTPQGSAKSFMVEDDWVISNGVAKAGDDLTVADEGLNEPSGKFDMGGNAMFVWQDYVAGTDPTNELSVLTATIEMVDGVPVVKWRPDLNEDGTKDLREYHIWGSANLVNGGDWEWPTNALHRFFKVTVEMP